MTEATGGGQRRNSQRGQGAFPLEAQHQRDGRWGKQWNLRRSRRLGRGLGIRHFAGNILEGKDWGPLPFGNSCPMSNRPTGRLQACSATRINSIKATTNCRRAAPARCSHGTYGSQVIQDFPNEPTITSPPPKRESDSESSSPEAEFMPRHGWLVPARAVPPERHRLEFLLLHYGCQLGVLQIPSHSRGSLIIVSL